MGKPSDFTGVMNGTAQRPLRLSNQAQRLFQKAQQALRGPKIIAPPKLRDDAVVIPRYTRQAIHIGGIK